MNAFTADVRIENDVLILRHCVEKTYQNREVLIVISVDFAKAFNSVKRESMVAKLINCKVNEKLLM